MKKKTILASLPEEQKIRIKNALKLFPKIVKQDEAAGKELKLRLQAFRKIKKKK